jgi:hypothetical protein
MHAYYILKIVQRTKYEVQRRKYEVRNAKYVISTNDVRRTLAIDP